MSRPDFQPHFTAAAVVERDGRFLVVHEHVGGVECINNPAGHVEDGESPEQAVVREVFEETGHHFIPEALGGIYIWRKPENGETFFRCNFIGRSGGHDPAATLDEGIIRPAWYDPAELRDKQNMLRSPLVARSFNDYLEGIRHPLTTITTLIEP